MPKVTRWTCDAAGCEEWAEGPFPCYIVPKGWRAAGGHFACPAHADALSSFVFRKTRYDQLLGESVSEATASTVAEIEELESRLRTLRVTYSWEKAEARDAFTAANLEPTFEAVP